MAKTGSAPLKQFNDSDLRLIRIFKAVVEYGGFTAAAPMLGVTRSAVSLHMSQLEARFDLKLCQRGRGGFVLTEEGRQVYEAGLRLLGCVENFKTTVNSTHRQLFGTLHIGITDSLVTLPYMAITHALAALKQRGPNVHLNLHMCPPSEVVRGVTDGQFQVGVAPELDRLSSLHYQPLYTESAYLYCSHQHPLFHQPDSDLSIQDIQAQDAIKPTLLFPQDDTRQGPLTETATATDREGTAFLILTGAYIGYLPQHFAQRWVGSGQMRALLPARYNHQIKYATITRRNRPPHRVLDTFLKELRHQIQD